MNFERDVEGKIVDANADGSEIHPFITVLAAIEAQERIIPPLVPRLTSIGWDKVKEALKLAISHTNNDMLDKVELPEVDSTGIEAAPEDSMPEIKASELQTEKAAVGRKPQKPIYKAG